MTWEGKTRPWCRGRALGARVPWIPRSTKDPFGDERFAVYSPPDQLRGLGEPGWWICDAYRCASVDFEPDGPTIGTLPPDVVEQVQQRLKGMYWTPS